MEEVTVYDIEYDTDGTDVELPKELKIIIPDNIIENNERMEFISDEISNITEYCHKGFRIRWK
jgi:hypothetical protein